MLIKVLVNDRMHRGEDKYTTRRENGMAVDKQSGGNRCTAGAEIACSTEIYNSANIFLIIFLSTL